MRSIESASHTALARLLPCLLLGSLGAGCNARLDISDETLADAGTGGTSGNGGSGGTDPLTPPLRPDAGTPTGSCEDGVRSDAESDIDCGGAACAACPSGASCERHTDCQSGTCLAGACVASSCEDGIRNGEETGVDCGGDCQRCRASTCNCASSPALTPLECDETDGYLARCGQQLLSADGQVFVFAMCTMEHADDGVASGYKLHRRRADGSKEVLGEPGVLGMSNDGQRLLIYEGGAVSVVNAEGARTVVPIPEALSSDARITGDGGTVFGRVTTPAGARTLARWTENGGLELLGEFPQLTSATDFEIGAVSDDGTVVVGSTDEDTRFAPFRWTAAAGLDDLGTLPEGVIGARPTAISADGSTFAGFTTAGNDADVFRWSAQEGLQVMGTALPLGSWPDSATLRLSADGTRLAAAMLAGTPRLVHFSPAGTQMANTGLAFVADMTADGSVVVGNDGGAGFLWRLPAANAGQPAPSSADDVTPLESLIARAGADSTGWVLETITNISDDARIVYGAGTCGGVPTYYRMQLDP